MNGETVYISDWDYEMTVTSKLNSNIGNVTEQKNNVTIPRYFDETHKRKECFRTITDSLKRSIEGEIKALLHAHRDTLRNLGKYDTRHVTFSAAEGYYGEAFGIMRTLHILGYGYFGSSNHDGVAEIKPYGVTHEEFALRNPNRQKEHNLRWWFEQLSHEVLEEEGYYDGTHRCEYCFSRYHKDTARMPHTIGMSIESNRDVIEARLSEVMGESIIANQQSLDPDRFRYKDNP